ncbi:DNA repair protein RecO C-terminal domain-containing protein, partial [Micromonospora sp. STR1_7]
GHPGAAHPAPATIDLMSALTTGDWVLADATDTGVRRECSGLVAAHLQWHLERALRSLPLVDRGPSVAGTVPPSGGGGAAMLRPRGDVEAGADGASRERAE